MGVFLGWLWLFIHSHRDLVGHMAGLFYPTGLDHLDQINQSINQSIDIKTSEMNSLHFTFDLCAEGRIFTLAGCMAPMRWISYCMSSSKCA